MKNNGNLEERFHRFTREAMELGKIYELDVAFVVFPRESRSFFVGGSRKVCEVISKWIDAHKAKKASKIIQ